METSLSLVNHSGLLLVARTTLKPPLQRLQATFLAPSTNQTQPSSNNIPISPQNQKPTRNRVNNLKFTDHLVYQVHLNSTYIGKGGGAGYR